ncbi:cellulose synthase subunit BcsC [Klebsiella pneumoniae]|nr:cellulose synthase subunit BcsC [Klebsiella pneumoniae]
MNKSLALLTVTLLLGGCQSLIHKTPDGTPPVEDTAVETKAKPEKYGSFSEDSLYSLLVAELAGQRNRFDIALSNYVVQAQKTRDPGVSERAFRIAEYLGADQEALDTSLLWARSAPDNLDAQRAAAIQLARAGRYEESMVYMEKVLNGQGDTHFDFLALSAAETDPDTRAGLLQSFDHLLKKYPNNGQLLFGKALLLQQDGRPDEALTLLEDNSASRHEVAPLLLRSRLLQSMKRSDEALPLLKAGIKEHPDDKRVRLAYARLLVEQNRLDDAKARVRRTGPAIPRRRRPAFLPGAGLPGSPGLGRSQDLPGRTGRARQPRRRRPLQPRPPRRGTEGHRARPRRVRPGRPGQ